MTTEPLKIGSLFSGIGGLDMAAEEVFGGHVQWFCENDKDASKVLAHHWPTIPNLGDVTAIDWTDVAPVDVMTLGFPCQDVSASGRKAGLLPGNRSGLWTHAAHVVNILRPRWVVVENVRGLLSAKAHRSLESDQEAVGEEPGGGAILRAAGAVCGDLASIGYDARWATVRASDVGAPHRRERVFLLAYPSGQPVRKPAGGSSAQEAGSHAGDRLGDHRGERVASDRGQAAADAAHDGLERSGQARSGGYGLANGGDDAGHGQAAADPQSLRRIGRWPASGQAQGARAAAGGRGLVDWGPYASAVAQWESVFTPAPSPTEPNRNGRPRLNAAFSEWMQGLPAGHVTDPELGITQKAKHRMIGNSVGPIHATYALNQLFSMGEL